MIVAWVGGLIRYYQSNEAAIFQGGYLVSTRVDRHVSFFI